MVKVELVFVAKDKSVIHLNLDLKQGARVVDALNESRIYLTHPETKDMITGIYSKQVSIDRVLKEGDRVEIYRPLALDPKEKRRQQARLKKRGR